MAVFDFPGAYLNTDIPEEKFIIFRIEGEFIDIMREVNLEHSKNVRVENGVTLLYLRLLTDLYCCV